MLVEVLEVIEYATSVEEYKNGLCLPKKGRARVRVINEDREMVVSFLNSDVIFAEGTIGYLTTFRKKSPILKECEGANSTNE